MSVISTELAERYRSDGFCVLERVLDSEWIDLLRDECELMMQRMDDQLDRENRSSIGATRKGLQYFPGNCSLDQPRLRRFILSELMADICRSLLGPNTYLFWEQYAVKFGEARTVGRPTPFAPADGPSSLGLLSWHQDSGYVPHEHTPYLTCWVALDDVTADRGPVRLLSYGNVGIRTRVQHVASMDNGDLVGYFGDQKGVEATVPAGSIVCFSSTVFHCSGRNQSAEPRRAFIAQYSSEPLMTADGSRLFNRAEPLTVEGKYVGAMTIEALGA